MTERPKNNLIQVGFENHTLIGDVLSDGSPPRLMVLHGAGNSCRQRFQLLREELFAAGISSLAFDFVGHGDTGGDLKSSSLRSRTRQARRVIDSFNWQQPFSVIGASMSAYTAVKLLAHYQIKRLVLLVPAMYSAQAEAVAFNRGFTEIIRQPQSWMNSDAWDILAQYTGRLLIVAGENDTIIPRGVINKIYDSAVNSSARELYIAPNASHFVFTDLRSDNPEEFEHIFSRICKTLKE
ncbi:MAG: alpha/beta fold hydrolase [Desulfobacterales bacterium]|nr:MAG: alpha/beta fold hydrolase [Desulfobacterales bacterium]